MELLRIIDIAGVAAFSISGAFAAMDKKLDIFGIIIIAFVTALGGGTLRDILIGEVPVNWMRDLSSVWVVLIGATTAILFTKTIKNYHKVLLLFDSIGLGFFTVLGIQIAVSHQLHPVVCIMLGTITACFGGVIRDISLNNIPLIFQKEIYATACIVGSIVFFALNEMEMSPTAIEVVCIAVVVCIRLLAVKYNWRLPALKFSEQEK